MSDIDFAVILCLSPLENVPSIKEEILSMENVTYFPYATKIDVIQWIKDHPGCSILCNPNSMTYRLDKTILSSNVVAISTASTGLDHIDLDLCKSLGIQVFSLFEDNILQDISSTAEMSFGLMMALIRNILFKTLYSLHHISHIQASN